MFNDLESHYQVQETKIIAHPDYWQPVLMTRYGWAKRGHETNWYETKIELIKTEEKNT
jgi:ABC-type polysaccharide transport system permease subunit